LIRVDLRHGFVGQMRFGPNLSLTTTFAPYKDWTCVKEDKNVKQFDITCDDHRPASHNNSHTFQSA
jgi:hypothetical protein